MCIKVGVRKPTLNYPPTIFYTKHIEIISTVQIFLFNDFPSSKNLLHDLRIHKAHYTTHFARGQKKKKHKIYKKLN